MMARKKVVKQRGHRTHGYGSPKKHRGKGNRGGKGWAGSEGHRKTFILKYARERIGKHGFTAKTTKKFKTINLREAAKLAGNGKSIDLSKFGYNKLLGTGSVNVPLEIKVEYFSVKAREKVEAAGGKILTNAAKKVQAEKDAAQEAA